MHLNNRNRTASVMPSVVSSSTVDPFLYPTPSVQFFGLYDHIGGVMVIVVASSAVDGGFEPRSDQAKDYTNGICCFSAKPRAKNQVNMSE